MFVFISNEADYVMFRKHEKGKDNCDFQIFSFE